MVDGSCVRRHLATSPSNVILNYAIFDRSTSTFVSWCETWFVSHVCRNAYKCAFASGSFQYFGYSYGMVSSANGSIASSFSVVALVCYRSFSRIADAVMY